MSGGRCEQLQRPTSSTFARHEQHHRPLPGDGVWALVSVSPENIYIYFVVALKLGVTILIFHSFCFFQTSVKTCAVCRLIWHDIAHVNSKIQDSFFVTCIVTQVQHKCIKKVPYAFPRMALLCYGATSSSGLIRAARPRRGDNNGRAAGQAGSGFKVSKITCAALSPTFKSDLLS